MGCNNCSVLVLVTFINRLHHLPSIPKGVYLLLPLGIRKEPSRKFRQSGKEVHEVHWFPRASFGLCCNHKRTAVAAILLLGRLPNNRLCRPFYCCEVAPGEVERKSLRQRFCISSAVSTRRPPESV